MLYDVEKVLERVGTLQPDESRLVFAEEIFDWTDSYSETLSQSPDTPEAQHAVEAIASLWIKYATMEQNLRQWKKAVQVYEDAVNDPVASRSPSVYLAYVDLCKARGKISNAQKIYIKALTGGFSQSQTDLFWQDFLKTMRENGSPDLTVDQLYAAVSSQVGYQTLTKPTTTESASSTSKIDQSQSKLTEEIEPVPKKAKIETAATSNPISTKESQRMSLEHYISDTYEIPSHSLDPTTPRLNSLRNLHELISPSISELLSVYSVRPTMLFRSLNPEDIKQITLFVGAGFDISRYLLDEIESYFGMKISMLFENDQSVPESKVSRVLDLIESLWISQGLNERYFDYWFSNLIQSQLKEESLLKTRFYDEEKVCIDSSISNQSTGLDILRSRHKVELRNFRIKSELQIQILNAYVNSVMEKILHEQLTVLSLLDGFPHRMLEKVESGDGEQQENFALFKQIVNALLSIRLYTRRNTRTTNKQSLLIPQSQTSFESPLGNSHSDINLVLDGATALEAARAAAVAAKKTTFKKKRRKISDLGARYPMTFYSSHYGVPTETRSSNSNDSLFQPTASAFNHSASNLHKLAAMLGKAKK